MEWTGSAWAGNGAYKERGPVFKVGDHSQIALWEASVPDSADWLQSRSRRANTHKPLSINQISPSDPPARSRANRTDSPTAGYPRHIALYG